MKKQTTKKQTPNYSQLAPRLVGVGMMLLAVGQFIYDSQQGALASLPISWVQIIFTTLQVAIAIGLISLRRFAYAPFLALAAIASFTALYGLEFQVRALFVFSEFDDGSFVPDEIYASIISKIITLLFYLWAFLTLRESTVQAQLR